MRDLPVVDGRDSTVRDMGEGEDCCRLGADCIQECRFQHAVAQAKFEATQMRQLTYHTPTFCWSNAEDPE